MAQSAVQPFPALQNQQFMNLITYRKSGQTVTTPVWFAQDGATLYVMTVEGTGKVKRIRNNAVVEIGPSDRRGQPLGPTTAARARIVAGAEAEKADQLLSAKYGLMKKLIGFVASVRGSASSRVFLAVEPAQGPYS